MLSPGPQRNLGNYAQPRLTHGPPPRFACECGGGFCMSWVDETSSAASCPATSLFSDFAIAVTTGTAQRASDTVDVLKLDVEAEP